MSAFVVGKTSLGSAALVSAPDVPVSTTDPSALVDRPVHRPTGSFGNLYSQTAADSASVSGDAATRTLSPAKRSGADSTTTTDAATQVRIIKRTASDSATVSGDSASRALAPAKRSAADSITTSDAATRSSGIFSRTGADSVTPSDAATGVLYTRVVRPSGDITVGNWSTVGASSMWDALNETVPSSTDKIVSEINPNVSVVEVALSPAAAWSVNTNGVLRVQAKKNGAANGSITTRLMQGTTEIASWTDAVTSSDVVYAHNLTPTQMDAITDRTNLRIRIEATVS